MPRMRLSHRGGFTLVEVLIALVLTSVIGAAVTSVFVSQSAFYDTQAQVTEARSVTRAAVNMLTHELRGVETTGGILIATPDTIRVQMPFALGVTCGVASTGRLHVALVPHDPAVFSDAEPHFKVSGAAGYAWRDPATGSYTYESSNSSGVESFSASTRCVTAGIIPAYLDMANRARVVALQAPSGSVPDAVPVMLYLVVTYYFAPSALVPGTRGLWRQVGASKEELAAPLDPSSRFRFYSLNNSTASDAPPSPVSNLRGVELALVGRSDRPDADGDRRQTPHTTAIFFRNRID